MKSVVLYVALLMLVAMNSFAAGRIVRLEPTSRLDTETTDFRRIDLTGWNTVGMNLSFHFANAVSNNVEIAIGCDAVFKIEVASSGDLLIVN